MLIERALGVIFKAIDVIDSLKRVVQPIVDVVLNKKESTGPSWEGDMADVAGASTSPKSNITLEKKPASTVVAKKSTRKVTSKRLIESPRAEKILANIKVNKLKLIKKGEKIGGKPSLAGLVWALSHAEKSQIDEGISVHDISALLYKAAKIEMYPINISRMVHDNQSLIRQVSQEKRTKRYLLTSKGHNAFESISRTRPNSGKKTTKTSAKDLLPPL